MRNRRNKNKPQRQINPSKDTNNRDGSKKTASIIPAELCEHLHGASLGPDRADNAGAADIIGVAVDVQLGKVTNAGPLVSGGALAHGLGSIGAKVRAA